MQYTNMQTFAQLTKFTVPEAFALKNTLKQGGYKFHYVFWLSHWFQPPLCYNGNVFL